MKLNLSFERSLNPLVGEQNPMKFKGGKINTTWEERRANIEFNLRRPLPQVRPYDPNPRPLVICGGGPSLKANIEKVKELKDGGAAICAINNSHQWLQDEHGITPSAYVALDAREFNSRFVRSPHPDCKYLVANQVHPAVFDSLVGFDTYIWHPDPTEEGEEELLDSYYGKGNWFGVPGGSTSFLRAFLVMRTLGYGNFHVFGFDSCYLAGEHHSYPQEENDGEKLWRVSCLGKEFYCSGWQIKQYEDFVNMFSVIGKSFRMEIYGEGMPAHLIRQLSRRPVQLRLELLARVDRLLGRNLRKTYLLDHDAQEEEKSNGGASI